MNRKILFSCDGADTFEILRNAYGYRIYQVITENEAKAVSGYYANAGELMDGLAELAIFSTEDTCSFQDIANVFREIKRSLTEYLNDHHGDWN